MKKTVLAILMVLCLLWTAGCVPAAVQTPTLADVGQSADELVLRAAARNLCTAVNVYNTLNPDDAVSVDMPLDELKEKLKDIYPTGISDGEMEKAQQLTEMRDGKAVLREDG
jgi:hypothetical protein